LVIWTEKKADSWVQAIACAVVRQCARPVENAPNSMTGQGTGFPAPDRLAMVKDRSRR